MAQNRPRRASEGAQRGAAVPKLRAMRAHWATKHHGRALKSPVLARLLLVVVAVACCFSGERGAVTYSYASLWLPPESNNGCTKDGPQEVFAECQRHATWNPVLHSSGRGMGCIVSTSEGSGVKHRPRVSIATPVGCNDPGRPPTPVSAWAPGGTYLLG